MRYQSAHVGDVVLYEDIKLEIIDSADIFYQCVRCFFKHRTCSGIACLGGERDDRNSIYYKKV